MLLFNLSYENQKAVRKFGLEGCATDAFLGLDEDGGYASKSTFDKGIKKGDVVALRTIRICCERWSICKSYKDLEYPSPDCPLVEANSNFLNATKCVWKTEIIPNRALLNIGMQEFGTCVHEFRLLTNQIIVYGITYVLEKKG